MTQFYPSDTLEKLEFDKINEILKTYCFSVSAKSILTNPVFAAEIQTVERQLLETSEFLVSLSEPVSIPISGFEPAEEIIDLLKTEGRVIEIDEYFALFKLIFLFHEVYNFLRGASRKYVQLAQIVEEGEPLPKLLLNRFQEIFNEKGEIKNDASKELFAVRKQIAVQGQQINRIFATELKKHAKQGLLADIEESIINGRRVFAVPAEFKRKIKGVLHSESTSGKTVYLEPDAIVQINNELSELHIEERKEIYKILRNLSLSLHPHLSFIGEYEGILARLDVIHAKAKLSASFEGNMPQLSETDSFKLIQAFHPLLYLKNKERKVETVPFDLNLDPDTGKVLMISGPNAGGKSILLKTVGLVHLMNQFGILPPVNGVSKLTVFKKFCVDIGDQQSIEDDLSTYSSRLKNAKSFLEQADEDTLLLIDEFGSGTDPKFGGAIAEAILHHLLRKGVHGVVTTHYSNLKQYAFKSPNIANGAMEFDKETLSPTYKMYIGKPGSSYAFEIATKSGLPHKVLNQAKRNVGVTSEQVDKLLIELQQKERKLEEQEEALAAKQRKMDRILKQYEDQMTNATVKKKRSKYEEKVKEKVELDTVNKLIQNEIRKLVEEKNIEGLKQKAVEIKQQKDAKNRQIKQVNKELDLVEDKILKDYVFKVGDTVKLRLNGEGGTIIRLKKDEAVVEMGIIKMQVKLRDLLPSKEQIEIKKERSIRIDTQYQKNTFESKVDIRGFRFEDANALLDEFFDKAILVNIDSVEIIHGKGKGQLRRLTHEKLRKLPLTVHYYHPEDEFGGDGKTIVDFNV